jgi:hypothetical protein
MMERYKAQRPKLNPHRRLRAETVEIALPMQAGGEHRLTVHLAYDANDMLREIGFVGRGKSGHGLDDLLTELGIRLSRAIQRRSPDDGSSLPPAGEAGR